MGLLPGFVLRRIHAHEFDLAGVVVDGNGTEFKEGDEIMGGTPVRECRVHPRPSLPLRALSRSSRTVFPTGRPCSRQRP